MTKQPHQVNQTALDFIAEAFWEDYTQGRPIDGGVAYEQQLRQLKLNGSIESLKQLDVFLMNVRKDIQDRFTHINGNTSAQKQQMLTLNDDTFRRLLMFIGFYSGKVLSNIWKSQCQWYGKQELQEINNTYVIDGDFSQSMGVRYVNQEKLSHLSSTQVAHIDNPWLFLPLEPISMRVFGGFDYQIRSVQGKPQVADGLYRAVMQRLPEQIATQIRQKEKNAQSQVQLTQNNQPANPVISSVATNQKQVNQPSNVQPSNSRPSSTQQAVSGRLSQTIPSSVTGLSTATASTTSVNDSHQSNLLNASNTTSNQTMRQVANEKINKTYDGLMVDLEQINFPQTHGVEQYLKSAQVMKKFDEHVKAQNIPVSEISFSDKHIAARNQALALMKASADLGNTSAMLHYASYLSMGKWLTQNQAQGVSLIQTAANTKDPRAMRLLSNLHYQGEGVSQDVQLGEYWLDQAADNGHPEAKIVINQMAMSKIMMDERKHDVSMDKQYLVWIGVTLLVGLFIFIIL